MTFSACDCDVSLPESYAVGSGFVYSFLLECLCDMRGRRLVMPAAIMKLVYSINPCSLQSSVVLTTRKLTHANILYIYVIIIIMFMKV